VGVVIGITGPIGSGKSVVADWFRKSGAEVIDVDKLAHVFLEPTQPTFEEIISAFGDEILDEQGFIDRKKLGEIVFGSEKHLDRLNRIVHPPLVEELRRRIREAKERPAGFLLAIDAALIFQWDLEEDLDLVIWLDAPKETRRERMVQSSRMNESAFEKRNQQQQRFFDENKAAKPHVERISNTGSVQDLIDQIQKIRKKVEHHEK